MVSNLPPLVADGGEIRLARRVASFVYGRREVEWPEDVDDPEELLPDGREFGWVAKLGDSEPGLSERRFVRADVKINAAEGYSDVEQVLDDSALRAGGEVYFESVIEEDGLGLLVPGVDFRQGDLVDVRFWGRILKDQLVTSIDWVDGKPSVALGGQSIRDTGELARARAEMVRLINGERADRVDDVSKVSKRVDTVDEKAEDALSGVDNVREALAGAGATTEDLQGQLEELNQQLQEAGEGTEENLPLIQAYIASNTQRWLLQDQVDALQTNALDDHEQQIAELVESQDQLTATLTEMQKNSLVDKTNIWAVRNFSNVDEENTYWRRSGQLSSRDQIFLAKGTWRGEVVITSEWVYDGMPQTSHTFSTVPASNGSREITAPQPRPLAAFRSAVLQTTVFPGEQTTRKHTLGGTNLSRSTWATLQTITVPDGAIDVNLFFRVHWDWASHDVYSIRITWNGATVGAVNTVNGLGPITPLGSGNRYMSSRRSVDGAASGTYRFEVLSHASESSQRRTSRGVVEVSWIMP